MSEYVPPELTDYQKSQKYTYADYYRVLNCWDCFKAQGKMCIDEVYKSLYWHTYTGNIGSAFCCKPDADDGYCKTGNIHTHEEIDNGETVVREIHMLCSEPSVGATDKYSDILTSGRNHQMFAFCPAINHDVCGIPSDNHLSYDMRLKAGLEKKHVQSNHMQYKNPKPENDFTKEYDACFYELTFEESLLEKYIPKKIHLQISNKREMNVYIYGGPSRFEATKSIIPGNE